MDAFWVLQSKFLRDHATHGNAEDVRSLDTGRIQHGCCIRGHQCDGIGSRRHIAAAHTSIVQRYRPIVVYENWPCTVPHYRCPAKPHNQQNGRFLTLFVPVNPGTLTFGKRHWWSSRWREDEFPPEIICRSYDSRLHMIVTYAVAIVYNAVSVWQIKRSFMR